MGKSLQGYTWEKKYPALKKNSLMTYNAEKNLTPLYVREKNFQLQRFGKKILARTKSPIPPPPQKSDGQPHRGWGRSPWIWHLSRCHVVVFKTKVLHFKIENTPIKDTSGKRKFKRVLRFIFVRKRELFAMKLSFEEFNLISFLKAFWCSFSEAIPIFFNRLKSGFFLVRSLKKFWPVIVFTLNRYYYDNNKIDKSRIWCDLDQQLKIQH